MSATALGAFKSPSSARLVYRINLLKFVDVFLIFFSRRSIVKFILFFARSHVSSINYFSGLHTESLIQGASSAKTDVTAAVEQVFLFFLFILRNGHVVAHRRETIGTCSRKTKPANDKAIWVYLFLMPFIKYACVA